MPGILDSQYTSPILLFMNHDTKIKILGWFMAIKGATIIIQQIWTVLAVGLSQRLISSFLLMLAFALLCLGTGIYILRLNPRALFIAILIQLIATPILVIEDLFYWQMNGFFSITSIWSIGNLGFGVNYFALFLLFLAVHILIVERKSLVESCSNS